MYILHIKQRIQYLVTYLFKIIFELKNVDIFTHHFSVYFGCSVEPSHFCYALQTLGLVVKQFQILYSV